MARNQTNVSSSAPTASKPQLARSLLFIAFLLLGGLLIAGGALLLLTLQPSYSGSVPAALSPARGQTNFAFLKQTASYVSKKLTVQAGSHRLDLNADILAWQRRAWFPQKTVDVRASQKPLMSVVLSTLGATNPWQAYADHESVLGFDFDGTELYAKLSADLVPLVNRPPRDAALVIDNDRATVFVPHQTGQSLDTLGTAREVVRALFTNNTTTAAVVVSMTPTTTLAQTNNLGIAELVAHGESDFSGSPKNRIHNIGVGASRFNGVIIKADEEFSFNRYLGPVTSQAGFKPELVIKPTGTVPELGGGLCQVSTTAFRAGLYGGLPITARRNHSYAVKYYAPQGTDATIYPGAQDLKFINDTGYAILVSTSIEGTRLIFDFYGTPDGRSVAIDGPYQYDRGAGGAMKARLARTVTKGGENKTQEFFSRYVSHDLFPTRYEFPKALTPQPPPSSPDTPPATTPPPPAPVTR